MSSTAIIQAIVVLVVIGYAQQYYFHLRMFLQTLSLSLNVEEPCNHNLVLPLANSCFSSLGHHKNNAH